MSLFLVFTEYKNLLPLSRDLRSELGEGLNLFARDVDRFLRNSDEHGDVSDSVKRYAAGVERAASDLGNRRKRRDELRIILEEHLNNPD